MQPENQFLEKEIPNLGTVIFRFYVKLEGISPNCPPCMSSLLPCQSFTMWGKFVSASAFSSQTRLSLIPSFLCVLELISTAGGAGAPTTGASDRGWNVGRLLVVGERGGTGHQRSEAIHLGVPVWSALGEWYWHWRLWFFLRSSWRRTGWSRWLVRDLPCWSAMACHESLQSCKLQRAVRWPLKVLGILFLLKLLGIHG